MSFLAAAKIWDASSMVKDIISSIGKHRLSWQNVGVIKD